MKKRVFLLLAAVLCLLLTGCSNSAPAKKTKNDRLVVGFAQINHENGWRDA